MPVGVQGSGCPLSRREVASLWRETAHARRYADDLVTVRCVDEGEISRLSKAYARKDTVTNVLTFSYGDGEHDIALCMPVARREAKESQVKLRSYVARLMAHAFLHVTGLDHEASARDARMMTELEEKIVRALGLERGERGEK